MDKIFYNQLLIDNFTGSSGMLGHRAGDRRDTYAHTPSDDGSIRRDVGLSTANPQSQANPDSSIPQTQQPPAASVDQPTAVPAPTGSDAPSSAADPADPSTPESTLTEATPTPVVEPEPKNPADPSTPDSTVAEATPTPVVEPEPKNPADPSTPDSTVVEATPIPVVEPEPEAPAMPRQLTNSPGEQLDPSWDPRGGTITFMTAKPRATERPWDIGAVNSDGTNQRVLATGPNRDIGIGGELSWVGETGLLMSNERIGIHSYTTFDTIKAPFNRVNTGGNDAAFTRSLVIPGGQGGDGLAVSRDGKFVMWMVRNSHNPASYVNTVLIALVSDLSGQPADAFGTVVHTHKAAADCPDLNRGFSISPDNKSFVISLKTGKGFDLFVKDTSSGQTIRRLTTNGEADGVLNHYPDVSPDGKWVAFSVRQGIGTKADLYIIRVDRTGPKQVTATQSVDEDRPSWSPNGKELAYGRLDDADPASGWDVYAIGVPN